MAISKKISSTTGVETSFHIVDSFMVQPAKKEIVVAVSSYISEDKYVEEITNRERMKQAEKIMDENMSIDSSTSQGIEALKRNEQILARIAEGGRMADERLSHEVNLFEIPYVARIATSVIERELVKLDQFKGGKVVATPVAMLPREVEIEDEE